MKSVLLVMPMFLLNAPAAVAAPKIKTLCVMFESAKISRNSLAKEGEFGRANFGHQVVKGSRGVLAIRIYEDDNMGPDSQLYKKMTLEFKLPIEIPMGQEVAVDVLRSHYVQGASAWVTHGGYSWATNPFARVTFRRDGSEIHAILNGKFDVRSTNPPRESVQVALACPVVRQAVGELTPWVGLEGTQRGSFYWTGD